MTAIEIRAPYYMLLFTTGLLGMQHLRAVVILAVKGLMFFLFVFFSYVQDAREKVEIPVSVNMLGIAISNVEERAFIL